MYSRSAFKAAILVPGLLAAALGFGAMAAPSIDADVGTCAGCGTVVDVDPIFARGRSVGSGALLGALVGGAVGNRIGSGRTSTTVAGAAAGAAMGYNAASRRTAVSGYTITVEMDGGDVRTIRSTDDHDLDRGDRVQVSDGRLLRL